MSSRHRRRRTTEPARIRPSRAARKVEHRKVRHETATEMHLAVTDADPIDAAEGMALPLPKHTAVDVDPTEFETKNESKRFKVWKTRAWKRRKQQQRERNAQLRQLRDA